MGGNPYSNQGRWYRGSTNDRLLNRSVLRFSADPAALEAVEAYQTSGQLTIPLVTLHTTGDEIIPYWHETLYEAKVQPSGEGRLTHFVADRYGHCEFTTRDIVTSFGTLVQQVTGREPDFLSR